MGVLMETTEITLDTASYLSGRQEPQFFAAIGTPGEYYTDTVHTIAINTMETDFGEIVEPIPITLKTYKPFHMHQLPINGTLNEYGLQQNQTVSSYMPVPHIPHFEVPSTSQISQPSPEKVQVISPVKEEVKVSTKSTLIKAPKKKWIKEYLEEEPKVPSMPPAPAPAPVSLRVVTGLAAVSARCVVPPTSPVPVAVAVAPPVILPSALPATPPPASILDFAQEHSRPRTTSNSHGSNQIPSPPSLGGSAPRAGTREVHNKLEKNRRAHLKECFELLKRQLPATPDDKKCSNLSILGSAIRYIQVLRRKERECEHEMERLAREKIAAQQRLAALKREVPVRPRTIDPISDDKIREEPINGQVLGISISASPPVSPPHSLNLSTKLRALPIQITPTTAQQVVRTGYGRHSTLTLSSLGDSGSHNGHALENGVATLVHPTHIHLPISQVVTSGGLVVGPAALQLLSTSAGLRVLQAPSIHTNGVTTTDNHRITKSENGIISSPVSTEGGGVVVNGLTPIVVSQPGTHLLQTHTLAHKMVESQMVKGSVTPLTLSTQYLSSTIVKPVVVVSTSHSHSPA